MDIKDLVGGKSVVIVGERGSGLSMLIEYLLASATDQDTNKIPIRCSARLLGGGTSFLTNLAYECVRAQYGEEPPTTVEQFLTRLRAEFSHSTLVELFEALRSDRGAPPVAVIDRFESLAGKLNPDAWAWLRYLIENNLIQLIVLSRLSIAEIETLTGSKLGPVLKQEILSPLLDKNSRRSLVQLDFQSKGLIPDILNYIGDICGGHRSLTRLIGSLVASHEYQAYPDETSFVDHVIGIHRDQIQIRIREIFSGLSPSGGNLPGEASKEFQCALEIEHAPMFVVAPYGTYFERLKRLGHIQHENGKPACFMSALLRSQLRQRWFAVRENIDTVASGYAQWLKYDDLLRCAIRQLSPRPPLDILQEFGHKFLDFEEEWKRDRVWWGESNNCDILDYMQADTLHELLLFVCTSKESLGDVRGNLEHVSIARQTITVQRWEMWSVGQRQQALSQLATLYNAIESIISQNAKQIYFSDQKPKTDRFIRWLHISDVHFRSERVYGEDMVLEAFLKTLKEEQKLPVLERLGPSPDLVFFTGDIAYSGASDQYIRARQFFDELLDLLQLDREHLFVVPGNHDVDRASTIYLERAPSTAEEAFSALQNERWRRLYGERLAAFDLFYRSYFEEFPDRSRITNHGFLSPQCITIRGNCIGIYLINALWCGGLDDDKGRLIVGSSVMSEDIKSAFVSESPDLNLALMHQPLEYLSDFEQKDFLLLIGRKVDAILRGHLHDNDVSHTVRTIGELTEFSAGALFSDSAHTNSAQFVEVNLETKHYTVYPVRYESRQNRWERDTSMGKAPSYIYEGQLIQKG